MAYNELIGLGRHSEPATIDLRLRMQDDAANTTVADSSSNALNGTLTSAGNTSASTTTGPTLRGDLPKGLALDGTNDFISLGNNLGYARTDAFSLAMWVRPDAAIANFVVFFAKQTSAPYGWALRNGGTGDRQRIAFQLITSSGQLFIVSDDNVFSSSRWIHIAVTYDGGSLASGAKMYVDGVGVAASFGVIDTLAGTLTNSDAASIGARAVTGGGPFDGIVSETIADGQEWTAAEVAEIRLGPEPLNTVAPTLTFGASTWTGTVGTWDSQSNGTITYAWELRLASDNSVVQSGTGSSPSGSNPADGSYYLWVRGTNDGGFDSAEDSVSTTQVLGGGGGSIIPLIHHHRQLMAA